MRANSALSLAIVAEPEPAEANPEVAVRVRFCDLAKMDPKVSGLVPAQLVLQQLGDFLEQAGVPTVHQQPTVAGIDGGLDEVLVRLHLPGEF